MSTVADLNAKIADQGSVVRKLKETKAPAENVQKEVLTLKELKAELAKLTGVDDKKSGNAGGQGSKKAVKFTLKTPKVGSFEMARSLTRQLTTRDGPDRARKTGTLPTCTSGNPSSARLPRCLNSTEASRSTRPSSN